MKKFTAVIATALFLSACSDSSAQETAAGKPILRYQGTANTVTPWELADDLGFMEDIELEWVGDTTSGPENIQATMTNDIEFGGAFNGAILQLQRAGAEVTSVIHYYGSNEETYSGYYVTEDSSLNDAADLIGHNVGVNTLGAHHEFAVIEYARQSGLSEAEIAEIGLVIMPPASGEQALRSRQLEATQLGGILRDKALEVWWHSPLFKDIDLFGPFNAGSIVFRDDYISENPEAVAAFVSGMAKAIEWTKERPVSDVQDRMRKIIYSRDRNETDELIDYWRSFGIESPGGAVREADFNRWINWLEQEGSLKAGDLILSDVYTNRFNPYEKELGEN